MSEEFADIYARGERTDMSAEEIWEDLDVLAAEVEWNVEEMVSEEESSDQGSRRHQR